MKKVVYLFIFVLLLSPTLLNAQLKFGLRGGIQDNVRLRSISEDNYSIDYKQGDVGFHFGVTSQLEILNLFVQPEILFSTNSNAVRFKEYDGAREIVNEIGKQRYNKLDVPILFGLKLSKLKVAAGPVFTAHLNSKSDLFDREGIDYTYNNATVGYQIGFGVEFDVIGLELRYEDNLSDYGTKMKIGDQSFNTDQRASQVMLSLCYYFGD